MVSPPVPGPPGTCTFAMPRHGHTPHELSTSAAASNTSPRHNNRRVGIRVMRRIAIRLLQRDIRLEVAVRPGPPAPAVPRAARALVPEPPPPAGAAQAPA